MSKNVKAVPEGYRTVTPYLYVRGAAKAIDFYTRAFGAVERFRMPGPNQAIMHAELQIGDSMLMLSDENPKMEAMSPQALGGCPGSIFLYVEDVDAWFARATAAGAKAKMPPTDMFWGDRFCALVDPYGHHWGIATHKEDVTPEEMARRGKEVMGG